MLQKIFISLFVRTMRPPTPPPPFGSVNRKFWKKGGKIRGGGVKEGVRGGGKGPCYGFGHVFGWEGGTFSYTVG